MNSAICTLFEGHYHLGLAAFVNSLHASGYRGGVWAGYRGPLPPWAGAAVERDGIHAFAVADGLTLYFVPVATERHLTNFKPDFMIDAHARFFQEAERVFYFDPDIVLKCRWPFLEAWADAGVALCEDVNSPMPSTHPLRACWKRFYQPHGLSVAREMNVYVNGGFVGLTRANTPFLDLWKQLQDLMAPELDGLTDWGVRDRSFMFHMTDQDALNIAAMFSALPVSIAGQDAMDFKPGGYLLSHALGGPKPWKKRFIRSAFQGVPPTTADKNFWRFASHPIALASSSEIRRKNREIRVAAAIGRFISRA